MQWIAYALGTFYVFAGAVAIRTARTNRITDDALEALTGDRTPLPEWMRRWFILAVGALVLAGGIALVLLSRWAAPIFIAGTLVQVAYLLYASRTLPPESEQQALGRRRTINAMYIYAAATAVVLWLEGEGVLT
jgi:hypothetical protein